MPREKNDINNNNTEDKILNPSPKINSKTISLPNQKPILLKQRLKTEVNKSKINTISKLISPKKKLENSKNKQQNKLQNSIIEFNPQIYKFYINNPNKNFLELKYKDNTINTTKYNIITFLPKSLLLQFMRFANIYFLIITIINYTINNTERGNFQEKKGKKILMK